VGSIWTPEGERPVGGAPEGAAPEPSEEELEAEMEELRRELATTPAFGVVANHCLGLFQLAALHLSLQPPKLNEAQLAIDALGAIVEGLQGRLGPDEQQLRDGLAQLRIAFVQIKSTVAGGAGTGDAGGSEAGGGGAGDPA
jgi:hypothetical protein